MDRQFLQLIKWLANQLNQQPITWALTGSTSFALQGLPFTPDDIDIQTDEVGAYKIERLFQNYTTQPVKFSSVGLIRSHFGSLTISGIKVEIMGDIEKFVAGEWEKAPDLKKIVRIIDLEQVRIPVLSLDYEVGAYQKLGRFEKAEIIRKYIN